MCDILQNNDDTDLFGILCRLAGEKDKFFSFKVIASSSHYLLTSSNQSNSGNNNLTLSNMSGFNQSTTTLSSIPNNMASSGFSSIYSSTTNLNSNEEHYQAQMEKKEYINF